MHESFGARLRQQREKKGVSLRTIAHQTKISLSLLEGLEKDDIRQWPAGIFRRAFVRDYAHAIGLDPDAIVREFVDRYPAPIEVPEPPPPPPGRFRSLVDTALGSLRPRAAALAPVETSGTPVNGVATGAAARSSRAARSVPLNAANAAAAAVSEGAGLVDVASDEVNADVGPRASEVGPRTADLGRRTSDLGPRAADVAPRTPDLLLAARICTELGRVEHTRQVPPLLREAAGLLGAKGLIVWVWDALSEELKPALALGYPSRVLSQLGGLSRDAD